MAKTVSRLKLLVLKKKKRVFLTIIVETLSVVKKAETSQPVLHTLKRKTSLHSAGTASGLLDPSLDKGVFGLYPDR